MLDIPFFPVSYLPPCTRVNIPPCSLSHTHINTYIDCVALVLQLNKINIVIRMVNTLWPCNYNVSGYIVCISNLVIMCAVFIDGPILIHFKLWIKVHYNNIVYRIVNVIYWYGNNLGGPSMDLRGMYRDIAPHARWLCLYFHPVPNVVLYSSRLTAGAYSPVYRGRKTLQINPCRYHY